MSSPFLLAAEKVVLGDRASPHHEWLSEWLCRTAREPLLWLFGARGFILLVHGATELASLLS